MAARRALGVTRPSSVDSPLMAALGNTAAGQALNDSHIQVYGWVNAGGNLSTNTVRGGNAPAAYDYNPNTVQLDQAVLYIERLPDTVQKDHVDWGFRLAPIYRRELSLHHGIRAVEQSASEPQRELRLRHPDGLWRGVHSAARRRA